MSEVQEEVLPRAAEASVREGSGARQFVTFLVGQEAFAVDLAPVQEIIRVPEMVRVPMAPAAMGGLANLRGRVLPIIHLRRLFGLDVRDNDDSTRAVVIDLDQPLGFVVDRVASVIGVEPGQIQGTEGIRGTVDSDLLTGVLKDVGGFPMIMVLDFARLIRREFADMAQRIAARCQDAQSGPAGTGEAHEDAGDELQLVSFAVADQEYAIDISRVQEIVQIPEAIVLVPNAPAHLLGLMNLRGRLLPLMSLRCLFGLPDRAMDEKSRIVVLALGGATVGVATDSVSEVLRVARQLVDPMPPLLVGDERLADISQVCRLDGGRRMVSIIAAERMFRSAMVKEALMTTSTLADGQAERPGDPDGSDEEEQFVVFRLAGGEFGVPIGSVQEIVRVPDQLTRVPQAPAFVEGVINLRGAVLPVIDQRARLGLPAITANDHQRIMVFLQGGVRTGYIVDAVTEVLKIRSAAIEDAPRLSSRQAQLLGRVANLETQKRLIQLIDPASLMGAEDSALLAQLAG
jgi:purine-binding chemotaxis protein CheW